MGMYTELHYNARLRQDTPEKVLQTLRHMLDDDAPPPDPLPYHPLFATRRWEWMLRCDSYYFAAQTASTLRYDDIAQTHFLCIRCNLKNYDSEISHFVNWINPWVNANDGDFLGFSRYEESENPCIIRKNEAVPE